MNASIFPQGLDSRTNLRRERVTLDLSWLHEDGVYVVFSPLVIERKFQTLHGLEDDTHGLDGVAEDDFFKRLAFIARVGSLVDKFHLFQDGRFSRLSSTCCVCYGSDQQLHHHQKKPANDNLPSRSILISFLCINLSLLSWFSISSFLAFPSLSSVLIPQPILAVYQTGTRSTVCKCTNRIEDGGSAGWLQLEKRCLSSG